LEVLDVVQNELTGSNSETTPLPELPPAPSID
jgi:hypothetical protein